jgi:hypothetical protein
LTWIRRREWRRLSSEELNDLYSPSNIFRVIKSRKMRWAGHVARMNDRRYQRKRDHSEGLGVEDNIKMGPQEVSLGGLDWIAHA